MMAQRTILYIEDEADLREKYLPILQSRFPDFTIKTASDSAEAIDIFRNDSTLVAAITDNYMPMRKGHSPSPRAKTHFHFLRREKIDIPLYVFSTRVSEENREVLESGGVHVSLGKTPEAFEAIMSALSQRIPPAHLPPDHRRVSPDEGASRA